MLAESSVMASGEFRPASSSHFYLKLWFCACITLFFVFQTQAAPAPVLYTDNDNVLILNSSNFADTVYGKDRAFTIEFYNSYCGHCQRYAPTWIKFAGDIKHWSSVVAPAVLDCAVSANVGICRDYEIPAFPTVKHFWTQLTPSDLGTAVPHKDENTVRQQLLDFLTQNAQQKGAPNQWPMLLPISAETLPGIWSNLPKEISSFFLVIEEASSYVGREIILDYSATDARILRVEDTSATHIDNLPEIEAYPALVLLKRNGIPTLLLSASNEKNARKEFRAAIEEVTGIVLDFSTHDDSDQDEDKKEDETDKYIPVQMVDIENALHNILVQEVALKKDLSEDNLKAFKSFLGALTITFPGRAPVMKFLQSLYNWVLQQGSTISSDDLQKTIKEIQSSSAFLPDATDWVGCKGSSPRFRGYTCGLWTLFHSMTVQAYNNYLAGETTYPQQVLHAIHDYVYHFFGCTECAEHFHSMAVNLDAETLHPNDTVLWLWRAHNKVNQRLKGDATEDPAHPKIQFPPVPLCRQCRRNSDSKNVNWNLPMALRFLMSYYGRSHISQTGVVPFKENVRTTRTTMTNKFPSFGWNFRYFSGFDISLCVFLYTSSVVLLIIVFLVFRYRRHRLKRKSGINLKHIS